MIRVYFVFEDPKDDTGHNLSYVDVPTNEPNEALLRVRSAASSGELWRNLYPGEEDQTYVFLPGKMLYLDISEIPAEITLETTLPLEAAIQQ